MKAIFLTGIVFFFTCSLTAQNNMLSFADTATAPLIGKAYFKSYLTDTKNVFKAPLKWETTQLIQFSVAGGLTGAALLLDKDLNNFFQSNKYPFLDASTNYFLDPVFSKQFAFPLLGLYLLTGTFIKNERIQRNALTAIKATLISGIITGGLKQVFHRHRPYHNYSPYIWDGPVSSFMYNSFPSGHATAAFTIATIVAEEFREKPLLGASLYAFAGIASISRVYENMHWSSDVIAGAVIGWAIGKTISRLNRLKTAK